MVSTTDAVTQAIEALVSEASSLRRVKHRLWLDTLAVCSGVRPAFMLDYCPRAPPRAVQTMCSRLTARLHKRIFALAWQGCLWVVSQLSLACRLESSLSSAPAHPPELWLIDFCEDDALGPPVVRRPHGQAQAHLQQMLSLFSWCSGGDPSSLEESLVELDDGVGIGNLPFVNGVLLGYPFVYNVTAQNVNRASAWLSASRLQLFRQKAIPTGRCDAQSQIQVDLWTCSAPLHALDAEGKAVDILECWRSWCQHHSMSAATAWCSICFADTPAYQQVVVL